MKHAKSDLLQGTLALLILRTLASGGMHGAHRAIDPIRALRAD